MAALATINFLAAAAAVAPHASKLQNSASGSPQSSYSMNVLDNRSSIRIGYELGCTSDGFRPPTLRVLSGKHVSGDGINDGKSGVPRRKTLVTKCVITNAVVERDTKEDASIASMLNSQPNLQERSADGRALKPAPKPVRRPSPQKVANAGNENRSLPKINGARPGNTEKTFVQTFKPGDKSDKPLGAMGFKSPISSLEQILEKAEKLNAQASSSATERRYVNLTWRKGDSISQKSSPPRDSPQEEMPANDCSPKEVVDCSQEAKARTGIGAASPTLTAEATKPEVPRSSVNAFVKPPSSKEPQLAKPPQKQIILKDLGAARKKPQMSKGKAVASKPAAWADVNGCVAAPPKTVKIAPIKSKEDWPKKTTALVGGKQRMGSMGKQADDLLDGDVLGAKGARRSGRKMTKASRKAARVQAAKAAAPVKVDILEVGKQGMSVPDLADKLAVNDGEIVKTLFLKGIVTTVNQTLDEATVKLVCQEFDVEVVEAGTIKLEDMAKKTDEFLEDEDLDHLQVRSPVVTIMGHVDHGKTSLLDYIRKSKVAAGEVGGITQGIGAYKVPVLVDGKVQSCVFLDTPGHQAFSAMRARGARVTDIAIIVVAADDGVKPQTQEAIAHAKAANVPIVVAINKIDKGGAEPERVMQELSGLGILPEEWGGDVPMVQVSALTGKNVDTLLETVMLVAEFQDLKANPNRSALGTVIESRLDKRTGVMATFLVQNGTLKKGDVVLCGASYGKVRALLDDSGACVDEAGPSTAVQLIGLSNVPIAGDKFEVLDLLEEAHERAKQCAETMRLNRLAAQAAEGKVTLSSLASSVAENRGGGVEMHQLNVVLKVDVQGTLEALREALQSLPQDTVNLRMLMQASGDVTASDLDLAIASEAIVIGFNVGIQPGVKAYAESKGVEVRRYRVIYELIDDIRKAMEGLLDVIQEEVPIGTAEVRAIFNSGSGKVAGCMVTDGKLVKGCGCKVVRHNEVIHTGTLYSLRRVKEIAKEVIAGLECGVGIEDFHEWQEGDMIEAFNLVPKKRTLEEASVKTAFSHAAVTAIATTDASKVS